MCTTLIQHYAFVVDELGRQGSICLYLMGTTFVLCCAGVVESSLGTA